MAAAETCSLLNSCEIQFRHTLPLMERLSALQREYEEIERNLSFPLDLEDFQLQIARRKAVLTEALRLSQSLNMSGDHWFNTKVTFR